MVEIKMFKNSVVVAYVIFMALVSCQTDETSIVNNKEIVNVSFSKQKVPILGRYIVVLKGGVFSIPKELRRDKAYRQVLRDLFLNDFFKGRKSANQIKDTYLSSIVGFSVQLEDDELNELMKDSRVSYIEQDYLVSLEMPIEEKLVGFNERGGVAPPSQIIPWGISRIGGNGNGIGKTAWVIDSGVDLDHPDLNVDINQSISFLTGSPSNQSPNDYNGHGTHVAGSIAAIDNLIGVVGVAAGANVVAVKVLDKRGKGSISSIISGVDYVATKAAVNDVANMSLGMGISSALDQAVTNAATKGVKFVLEAGDEGNDVNTSSPARVNGNNIYTVSAMDLNDDFATFSNYGTTVDYCAPGVDIGSTWIDGGYNTISGTSTAAPHVAGILLLGNINNDGGVNNDPDGNPDLIAIR